MCVVSSTGRALSFPPEAYRSPAWLFLSKSKASWSLLACHHAKALSSLPGKLRGDGVRPRRGVQEEDK